MVLGHLQPQKPFAFFEEICQIPHGSGNEQQISDYLMAFAQKRGLEAVQDAALNVCIKKPGSKGYENSPPVILQGHMDMVCEKNMDTVHDFKTDPLQLYIDGNDIKARGTTLGADNGIAVAMILAILDADDIAHPPLEAVITSAEEIGLLGAAAFDGQLLTGKRFINLDSEEEGVFVVSCAGGMRTTVTVPATFAEAPKGLVYNTLWVKGLQGGHSGLDITKERANANRLLARVLFELTELEGFVVAAMNGGAQDNAIPREAWAIVGYPEAALPQVDAVVKGFETIFKREYSQKDDGVILEQVSLEQEPAKVFTAETLRKAVAGILMHPNGVEATIPGMNGLPETSNNVGVVRTLDDGVQMTSALRSALTSKKILIKNQIALLAESLGASFDTYGDYPGWAYEAHSPLRDVFMNTYREMRGKEPVVEVLHAGLECGLFADKIEHADMISFGPNMADVHTPDERISITSIGRTWDFLLLALSKLIE